MRKIIKYWFVFLIILVFIFNLEAASPDTRVKNIILFIGDGMGLEHIRAAGMYLNGEPGTLIFESFPYQGTVTTHSANKPVTDSAAAATAMATGKKVNNGTISMAIPGDSSELTTLLEYYSSLGKSTGLVTTTFITHATPAAFAAHEPHRLNYNEIAGDYFTQTRPTLLFGGGGFGVSPELARVNNYTVVTTREELETLGPDANLKVSGQFGTGHFPYEDSFPVNLPTLKEMTEAALAILANNNQGFFLMIEGGRIDHASHANDIENTVLETIKFHEAVSYAYEWAGLRGDTFIIVTADHETGDLKVLENNGKGNLPGIAWGTGGHTGKNVGIYAYGNRGSLIKNVMDNTDIYSVLFFPQGMNISRTVLNFGYAIGGNLPPSQSIFIDKEAGGLLRWEASGESTWIHVEPYEGTGSDTINVSVEPGGLTPGNYTGSVTVTDLDAINPSQAVVVNLNVKKYSHDLAPLGYFETPIDGSIVSSSIAVTGWALDDIGVESLKIYREPGIDEGNQLIYIGDGFFVEGARPDVEQAYPGYPNNYKAGWGYMMLTNFLPNGNGRFTLHAVAEDIEGNVVTLGTKTIIVDNANAIKPFGAMDTPKMGETVGGKNYRNQGWALTPLPNTIPVDGSTIKLFIDGIAIGNLQYNNYRQDIATFFPGYANSDGALAYVDIDTGLFKNGVHTIAWQVTDNAGNTDGVGSRFFTIFNADETSSLAVYHPLKFSSLKTGHLTEIPDVFARSKPVRYWKGNDNMPTGYEVFPDRQGIININIKELERLVIKLSLAGPDIAGYMIVGNQLRPLPIGSTLDTKSGTFYWQPGPGFIREYILLFKVAGSESDNEVNGTKTPINQAIININIVPTY
jgi:alkaline phosphatase